MRNRQRGATFIGMVVIIMILGAGLYAAIRLVPVYLEFTKVARALEQVRDEEATNDTNSQMIRRALEKRWDVEDIESISWRDVEIRKSGDGGFDVEAAYSVERPFAGNVYLLAKFDKLVTIQQ
jgi:hypothetical protein